MSLSSWFREYVYIPLGGNRKGLCRQLVNILIVWSLTGIWHGAGWNFLLWGMWFALFLILEKIIWGKALACMPKAVGWIYTMAVVLVSWCFFSLEQTDKILLFLKSMFGFGGGGLANGEALYVLDNYRLLFVILAIAALPLGKKAVEWVRGKAEKDTKAGFVLTVCLDLAEKLFLAAVLLLSVANIVDASYNPFLYFRF